MYVCMFMVTTSEWFPLLPIVPIGGTTHWISRTIIIIITTTTIIVMITTTIIIKIIHHYHQHHELALSSSTTACMTMCVYSSLI